jgi:hypothetical protein
VLCPVHTACCPLCTGEKGLVAAQSAADIVAFVITIPLLLRVLRHLKDEGGTGEIRSLMKACWTMNRQIKQPAV